MCFCLWKGSGWIKGKGKGKGKLGRKHVFPLFGNQEKIERKLVDSKYSIPGPPKSNVFEMKITVKCGRYVYNWYRFNLNSLSASFFYSLITNFQLKFIIKIL